MPGITNLSVVLNRDLVLLHKGDTLPVSIDSDMAASGWSGGQFVRWVDAGTGMPTVTVANGTYCGFMMFGSDEEGDQWTSFVASQVTYKSAILTFGGNVFYTRTYEVEGYMYRHGLGPSAPLVYEPNQVLYISENGKITNENESNTALFPAHDFPDGSPIVANSFVFFGVCSVPPDDVLTSGFICVQTNFGV